jgi:Spy/CpxP family protein refolding chaperone
VISFMLKLNRSARWLIMPALLCCVLAVQARAQNDNQSTPVAAPSPAQTEEQRPGENELSLMDALNLTPEQRTQLVAIAQQRRIDEQAAQLRLRTARRALNQAIYQGNPDQNLINQRVHDLAAAREVLDGLRAQAELKVRQVLTPEQLRAFIRIRNQRLREQRLRQGQGQPDGTPRRPLRERFPNANRQPNDTGTPVPAEQIRGRKQRRQLPGARPRVLP